MVTTLNENTKRAQNVVVTDDDRLCVQNAPKYVDLGKVFDATVAASGWGTTDLGVDLSWVRFILVVLQAGTAASANSKVNIRKMCPTSGAPDINGVGTNSTGVAGTSSDCTLLQCSGSGTVQCSSNNSQLAFGAEGKLLIYNGHTADQNMKVWVQLLG